MDTATGSIIVEGARVAYSVDGDGDAPVTLIHGFAAHRRWWDAVVTRLRPHCRVVRLDLTGHGDSDHRDGYDFATWAAEVAGVQAAAFGGAPSLVVGASLGGHVAIASRSHPDSSTAAVMVLDTRVAGSKWDRPSTWRPVRRVYATREEALERFRLVPAQPMDPERLRALASLSVREVADGWTWKHDHRLHPTDLERPSLEGLGVPLTVAHGEHSPVMTAEMARSAALASGSAATWHTIAGGHHHVILDSPEQVAGLIISASARHGSDRAVA
ncbi:MAG: alpha/beta hydrolase [Microbacterium sp.]